MPLFRDKAAAWRYMRFVYLDKDMFDKACLDTQMSDSIIEEAACINNVSVNLSKLVICI